MSGRGSKMAVPPVSARRQALRIVFGATLLGLQCLPGAAWAENQMGYQLLPAQQAGQLQSQGGVLGVDVGAGQRITDSGMAFELLQVKSVRRNSPGAQAGLGQGDQIIAVDGRVFPSVAAFAAFVGSKPPGQKLMIDYMPAGGGPEQAQRVSVTLAGKNGAGAQRQQEDNAAQSSGMSTGTKLAIGAGAAALFGCYKLGCFSHSKSGTGAAQQPAR